MYKVNRKFQDTNMLSPLQNRDKVVRATDLDALSCRYSANKHGYFDPVDPYMDDLLDSYRTHLAFCAGYTNMSASRAVRNAIGERKFPLINKGTYIRTQIIDAIIEEFVMEFPHCQIVSLGGGSDTRCFRLLESHPNVHYTEIDFEESARIKKLAIARAGKLRSIIRYSEPVPEIKSREEWLLLSPEVHTENYHLVGMDLRNIKGATGLDFIDPNLPTLVLSECALCYLLPEENMEIIQYWKQKCPDFVCFLIYEPMSLDDAFGITMALNLQSRGIRLQAFNELPDLDSRRRFLATDCGLNNVRLTDICNASGYTNTLSSERVSFMNSSDLARIGTLELIDEIEEIILLFKHYCVCYGEHSQANPPTEFTSVNKWDWQS